MNPITISGFKAYDLRGRIPGELNEDVAYRVGRAYAEFVKPKKVIVGRDIRLSSEELCNALTQGLLDSGVDVYDIGLCGTEVVYFATFAKEMDGGIMVTASHNPPDYNGMKFVREAPSRSRARSPSLCASASASPSTSCRSTSSTCCRT